MKKNKWLVICSIVVMTLTLWKCDSDSFFSIGGKVSGLDGTVVLQNNEDDDLEVEENGEFTFDTLIADQATYEVTVKTQPTDQTCTVTRATGTAAADITNVKVVCADDETPPPASTSKKTFVTAVNIQGDLGGISGADDLCMNDANYPGTGTYKAMIVFGTDRVACTTANCSGGVAEHDDWVLAPDTEYTRVDGTTVIATTNADGIWTAPLDSTYDVALGTNQDARIWVGLNSDWTSSANNCNGWTDDTGGNIGNHARRDEVSDQAINYSNQLCLEMNAALLCVEQ